MWESRCAAGDPIGCVGFATWGRSEDILALHGGALRSYWIGIGATVRTNARNGLVGGNLDLLASESVLEEAMLSFGKAIATAHLDATALDKTNRHYFLSPSEITEYHHQVFDDFNVDRRWYGGSYIIGVHVPPLSPIYCIPSCDKE